MSDAPSRPADGAARARRWGPLLAWTTLLGVATSGPTPHGPAGRAGDTVVHALLYGVLAYLAGRALFWPGARAARLAGALAVLVAASAFGWADEWPQQFIPGRSRSVADWQADTVGALGGAAAAVVLSRRRAQRLT